MKYGWQHHRCCRPVRSSAPAAIATPCAIWHLDAGASAKCAWTARGPLLGMTSSAANA